MDKIDNLLDAIENPDRYSDREMEAMLADQAVAEVYDLLNKTKASLATIPTPDVDAEWKAFEHANPTEQQHKPFRILNLATRNIAASIAISIVSIAAVAAVVGVSINYVLTQNKETPSTEVTTVVQENVDTNNVIIAPEGTPATAPETIVFDNEPLETIIKHIAEYYGYKVEFSTDAPKSLRLYFHWNQAQTLDDVVESLNNFEQIHIIVKDKTIKID